MMITFYNLKYPFVNMLAPIIEYLYNLVIQAEVVLMCCKEGILTIFESSPKGFSNLKLYSHPI